KGPSWGVIVLAYGAFLGVGVFGGSLGVAWPSMRATFGLDVDALGLLLVVGMIGQVGISGANGRLLQLSNMPTLLLIGLSLRLVGYMGQTVSPSWLLMIAGAAIVGVGSGIVNAGLNTFAAARFRPRLLNWMHASFAVGTMTGSSMMTFLLWQELSWRVGILVVVVIHMLLVGFMWWTRDEWRLADAAEIEGGTTLIHEGSRATLALPMVWLSMVSFFLYTGLEWGVGHWVFTVGVEGRGAAETVAGLWTTLFWGSLMMGRIVLGFIEVNPARLVRWVLVLAIIGIVLFALNLGNGLNFISLVFVGFGLASIFPSLIALTPRRVGKQHAANAIGFQIAAGGIGASLWPAVIGWVANQFGVPMIMGVWLGLAVLLLGLQIVMSRKREVLI
ncbi:MAG TPA: MFS transporter, partial [Anaerolineae bacterium]|nr:MFS transporter [Anaerolineae bacterium]